MDSRILFTYNSKCVKWSCGYKYPSLVWKTNETWMHTGEKMGKLRLSMIQPTGLTNTKALSCGKNEKEKLSAIRTFPRNSVWLINQLMTVPVSDTLFFSRCGLMEAIFLPLVSALYSLKKLFLWWRIAARWIENHIFCSNYRKAK